MVAAVTSLNSLSTTMTGRFPCDGPASKSDGASSTWGLFSSPSTSKSMSTESGLAPVLPVPVDGKLMIVMLSSWTAALVALQGTCGRIPARMVLWLVDKSRSDDTSLADPQFQFNHDGELDT